MLEILPVWIAQADADAPPVAPDSLPATTSTPGAPGVGPNGVPATQPASGGGMEYLLLFMVGFMVLILLMSWRTQSKERKKREKMLSALTKGAKVQTIGGMIGTITAVRDDEIVVRIDENNNTTVRFTKGAIQTVVSDD
ncbi:MAG: preprotein translocase subunit YajC [Phycisphaeraceae bacterium]